MKFVNSTYVDDTSLFLSGNRTDDIVNEANATLRNLDFWSTHHLLQINARKIKAIFFQLRNKLASATHKLTINNTVIEIAASFNILDVYS